MPENTRLAKIERIMVKKTAISNPKNRQASMAAEGIGMIMKKDREEISQVASGFADWAIKVEAFAKVR